jgi:hypothetical protein
MQDSLKMVAQKEALALQVSERVVPYKIARHVILENPGTISVGTCACRAVQHDPCLSPPQEVCPIRGKTEGQSTAPRLRRAERSTLGRYIAPSGVAPRTDRGAKAVQLSSRQMQGKLPGLEAASGLQARNRPTPATIPFEITI